MPVTYHQPGNCQQTELPLVGLYKALGGGWQQMPEAEAEAAAADPKKTSKAAPKKT